MAFTDWARSDDSSSAAPYNNADSPAPGHEHQRKLIDWIAKANLTDEVDDRTLNDIGQRVKQEYDIDDRSRDEWKTKIQAAIALALQDAKEKQYPWPKAANVIFPILTTASMQFAARAYPGIVQGKDVVKGIVVGPDAGIPMIQNGQPVIDPQSGQPQWMQPPGFERVRADRIAEHMSWQLLDEMVEWESETDTLLHLLPIAGSVFRKTYFDPTQGRNVSLTVSPLKVVINYHAKSVETVPRITEEIEFYPIEIEEFERAGLWRKVQYTHEQDQGEDRDAPRHFLEQHRWWDLDNDGYSEPYIITVHRDTMQVVRIKARYDEKGVFFDAKTHHIRKIDPVHYYTKYDFLPNPDGGVYGIGFGTLLKPINEAVNTTLNLMIDAGHLANVGGGFIGRGFSLNSGAVRFSPGEYKQVNVPGSTIKDNIVPIQFPGPSMVLFQLLGLLIDAGREIAAVKDVLSGEQQQHNIPATTTLALIEQGLKVFTAIFKRVHRSLKQELKKLYRLNSIYLEEEVSYRIGNQWKNITRADYAQGSGVEPISDPTMVSDVQRLGKAQYLQQFITDPFMNPIKLRQRLLEAAQIEKPEELIMPPGPNPIALLKAQEVQIKQNREQAAALRDTAQALLFFVQADATVGDAHIDWAKQQLEAWRAQVEAFNAYQQSQQPAGEGQPPPPSAAPVTPPGHPAPGPSHLHPGAAPLPGTPPRPTPSMIPAQ